MLSCVGVRWFILICGWFAMMARIYSARSIRSEGKCWVRAVWDLVLDQRVKKLYFGDSDIFSETCEIQLAVLRGLVANYVV